MVDTSDWSQDSFSQQAYFKVFHSFSHFSLLYTKLSTLKGKWSLPFVHIECSTWIILYIIWQIPSKFESLKNIKITKEQLDKLSNIDLSELKYQKFVNQIS